MWTVIRKRQQLPANENPFDSASADERLERNQRIILMHEAKANIPEMDPKLYTRAYDTFDLAKVKRWLLDEDPNMRLQACTHLIELYVEKREHCVMSLDYDALPILVSMMCTDEESTIRERAATALEMLVREPRTQAMIQRMPKDPLEDMLAAIHDPCDGVVVLALRVLAACHAYHNSFALSEALFHLGSVPELLGLVRDSENLVVRATACTALLPIFDVKEAFITLLKGDGIRILTDALMADDDMLAAAAAAVISRAAEYPQGKRDAVTCETLGALLPYLPNLNLAVRVAVVEAMAQITVLETAKAQSLDLGIPEAILAYFGSEDERDVLVHLAKLIYHIAEHPEGREALRPCRARLDELLGFTDAEDLSIRHAFMTASEILTRK